MRLACYAHPFDLANLAAHGGLARLRDLGFAEVAMATSYHAGRWLQPWNERRVRFLEDGVVHFRTRGDYGELVPLASSEVPASGPSPLERWCAEADKVGLGMRAWSIGTHNTRLGALHADRCVVNAFGDGYRYALCPSQPAVQQYLEAMVRDLAAHDGLSTIEFEAYGQMGFKHSSHHDKASFTPSGLFDAALSACFCAACSARHRRAGDDVDALRRAVVACVEQHAGAADAMSPDESNAAETPPWLVAVLQQRAQVVRELAARLVAATPATGRAVQVHQNPNFTGSQLAAASASAFPSADERVFTCYGEGVDSIARLLASEGARGLHANPRRLCVWPKAPQFRTDEDLVKLRELCAANGITSLAIYHLGLLPWRTIERVAKMFAP